MMISDAKAWLLGLPNEARNLMIGAVALTGVLALLMLSYAWSAAFLSWQEISSSEPRIARLKGYELAQEDIRDASGAAALALQAVAFNDKGDETQVGARLQQILRAFAEEAGLTIGGSQLLPPRDDDNIPDGFTLMKVQLNMSGMPEALMDFLQAVYAHSPTLDVTRLYIAIDKKPNRRRQKEASIEELQTLRVDVYVSALLVIQ
jgi:hypothetical protein